MENQKEIQAAQNVLERTQLTFAKRGFTLDNIAKELALIAFADMADFIQVDAEGSIKPLSFEDLKKGKSRIIKKIREKRRILNGKEDDTILEDTFEFELYSKLDAFDLAVSIAGLKAPVKQDVKFPDKDGNPQEIGGMFTDMERAAKLVYLLDQASKRDGK